MKQGVDVGTQLDCPSLGPMPRRLCWLAVLAVCLGAGGNVAPAQTTFPVRLDSALEPLGGPATVGALSISNGTHYSKLFSYAVLADTERLFLRVTAGRNTLLSARVTAVASNSAGDAPPASREEFWAITFDENGFFNSNGVFLFEVNSDDHSIARVFGSPPSFESSWGVNTPPGYDQVIFEIEVFANRPVTFTELP